MNSFNYILILWAVLIFIIAVALCLTVRWACKAGVKVKASGSVEVSVGDKP